MKQTVLLCLLCSLLLVLPACTNTTRGAIGGSAIGAATGLGIAAISGGYLGYGALAGAGAGALAGGILGHQKDQYEEERQRRYEEESRYHRNQYRRSRHNRHDYEEDDEY